MGQVLLPPLGGGLFEDTSQNIIGPDSNIVFTPWKGEVILHPNSLSLDGTVDVLQTNTLFIVVSATLRPEFFFFFF